MKYQVGDWVYISDFFKDYYQDLFLSSGPHCVVATLSRKDAEIEDDKYFCNRPGVMFKNIINIYVNDYDYWVPDCDVVPATPPHLDFAAKERSVYESEGWRQRRDANLAGVSFEND